MAAPVLPPADLDRLRQAIDTYTVDAVQQRLGLAGQAALARGDLIGARRALAAEAGEDRVGVLTRLFVLGDALPEPQAAAALDPLPLDPAVAAGLVERCGDGEVRAALDLRPYAEVIDSPFVPPADDPHGPAPTTAARDGSRWWVVSDLGSDLRAGPVRADHVLGVGAASLTLAQATPRQPVGPALDVGTGCGVQALHLAGHAAAVTATDISPRALRLAATTAALSGQHWDLREGSLLDPVEGDRFDLVVANPPFVVSPGATGDGARYEYRDSGLRGDEVSRRLVRALPDRLTGRGTAQLLANWVVTRDEGWDDRVGGWLEGLPCDAWVWQRELSEPGEYVAMWLRDAGEQPGTARWDEQYTAWREWFDRAGVLAIGLGLITLWSTDRSPIRVLEDVPQPLAQPIGPTVAAWPGVQRWLARTDDAGLLDTALRLRPDVRHDVERAPAAEGGWEPTAQRLRQLAGMRWEIDTDDAVATLLAGCTGGAPLRLAVDLLAATLDLPAEAVDAAVLPVVRDLVGRGFLLVPGLERP
ncbi:MAG: DUF7782 domain-containing protein [Jatrophihabitans sp.]|uniref:DUF7782 domain-containing protein n=1 Tax=Jatrophihabitans sp. TaxID=1932789 RepID=UPI003F7D1F6F